MAHLEVHLAEGVRKVSLEKGKVGIGRSAQNAVVITNDSMISRNHCEVEKTAQGYVLRDLNSRNGTVIEGVRIVQVVLQPDIEFSVGGTKVRFVDESPAARRQPARTRQAAAQSAPAAGNVQLETADPYTEQLEEPEATVSGPKIAVGAIDALRHVGNDVGFTMADISMINTRGQTVHSASAGDDQGTAESLRLLRLILFGCVRSGASDVHLEPKRNGMLLRLRIDGAMVEIAMINAAAAQRLTSLVKVLCDIDISKRSVVQDGHFSANLPGRRVDYRISFTPSMFGQKLVIRVLDPQNAPQKLRDLQLPGWIYEKIRETVRQDTGMLLVCGPTGSGKTTTLYAALRNIDAGLRNIITIEDPVEYEVPGVTQMPVNDEHGQSFLALLRSCMRQDPDVIVLGEVRDKDTAETAMQAATTGHLVLTTLHAKDTIGTVFRLLDLGVEPYLVASTLNLVLAQRLARVLCDACKEPRKPTQQQVMALGRSVEGLGNLHGPVGCPQCFNTGYRGRMGIYELMVATDEVRDVILNNPNVSTIKKTLEMTMFRTLRQSGIDLVLKGTTSLDEVNRVIGLD